MNTHIDTLAEWFDSAEDGDVHEGDTFIRHLPSVGRFVVGVADEYLGAHPHRRILSRAPKPKPTWHDAPAVTAKGREDWDHVEAFSRNDDYDPPRWIDNQGITYTAEQLSDVTPLIEAKVTDETARTVLDRYYETETGHDWPEDTIALMRLAVTAALGLESA